MKLALRVDDLGRSPNDPFDCGTDARNGWAHFRFFRDALGLQGEPVVWAATPAWIDEAGLRELKTILKGREELALHGWDHRRGATVTQEEMRVGVSQLENAGICRTYVPPFNEYNVSDVVSWLTLQRRFDETLTGEDDFEKWRFLGMSDGPSVNSGGFIACPRNLYGQAIEVTQVIHGGHHAGGVATLHLPWEKNADELRAFGDAIRPHLVAVSEL